MKTPATPEELRRQNEERELATLRKKKAKRPMALRRAERDLVAVREKLKAVGYQAGDAVYHAINDAIGAVKSDLNALSK